MSDDVLAIIEASAPRRWMAISMQAGLGLMLVYFALTVPGAFAWQAFLLLFGIAWFWLATSMYAATQLRLELTETGVRDSSGEELVALDEVESVSRGMFAFKPSNGFSLVLKQRKGPARWRPGLWWRLGSRVGIGGVTAGSQTKPAAQIIEAILAERFAADT